MDQQVLEQTQTQQQPQQPDLPPGWSEAINESLAEAGEPVLEAAPAVAEEPAKAEPEPEPVKPEPAAAAKPNRAFELLEKARAEAAKRDAEIKAKRAPVVVPETPPAKKPTNAFEALEVGGFSVDDLIRETLRTTPAAEKGKADAAPVIDQDKLLALIQERTAKLVEDRVQAMIREAQEAQAREQELSRAQQLHDSVIHQIGEMAAELKQVAAVAKRNPVAATEAIVAIYDSVYQATGRKLTMPQALKRWERILEDDAPAPAVVAAQAAAQAAKAKKPVDAADDREQAFADALAIIERGGKTQ